MYEERSRVRNTFYLLTLITLLLSFFPLRTVPQPLWTNLISPWIHCCTATWETHYRGIKLKLAPCLSLMHSQTKTHPQGPIRDFFPPLFYYCWWGLRVNVSVWHRDCVWICFIDSVQQNKASSRSCTCSRAVCMRVHGKPSAADIAVHMQNHNRTPLFLVFCRILFNIWYLRFAVFSGFASTCLLK